MINLSLFSDKFGSNLVSDTIVSLISEGMTNLYKRIQQNLEK